MSAGPRFEFVVPAFAARHRHEIVRQAIALCQKAFSDRFDLRKPAYDHHRNVVREPLHMFMMRAKPRPAIRRDGTAWRTPDDLERRRADHFQTQLALWVTMVALADFETWAVYEHEHDRRLDEPYPTMLRLAELADIIRPGHGLSDAPDKVWRARAELERAGLISHTKEWRVEIMKPGLKPSDPPIPTGRWRSSGGALRRLGVKVLAAIGGAFGRAILDQIDSTKAKRAKRAQEAKEFKQRIDALWAEERRQAGEADATAPPPVTTSAEDDEADRVHEQNPSWPWSKIIAEARRRLRELARAGPALTDDS